MRIGILRHLIRTDLAPTKNVVTVTANDVVACVLMRILGEEKAEWGRRQEVFDDYDDDGRIIVGLGTEELEIRSHSGGWWLVDDDNIMVQVPRGSCDDRVKEASKINYL